MSGRWVVAIAAALSVACGEGASGPGAPAVVASITISVPTATLLTGEQLPLTATPRTAEGTPVPGVAVTWSSSDSAVVRVGPAGEVQARALGVASVRAAAGGRADSARIIVLPSQVAELAGAWRMRAFDARLLPAVYAEFFDEPVGDRIVHHVEIRLDSAVKRIRGDGTYERRFHFSELHDGVLTFQYLWGDHGRVGLGTALARGAIHFASEYIQHLFAAGMAYADRTLRLDETLWVGEALHATFWEWRAP